MDNNDGNNDNDSGNNNDGDNGKDGDNSNDREYTSRKAKVHRTMATIVSIQAAQSPGPHDSSGSFRAVELFLPVVPLL